MLRFAYLLSFRNRAAGLWAIGLLAVALHVLAGTGLLRSSADTGKGVGFAAELCTSHGVVAADPAQTSGGGSPPDTGSHDCCKLCAAGGPLLAAELAAGVPPAPTFAARQVSLFSARPTQAAWTAHPPRGPPAQA